MNYVPSEMRPATWHPVVLNEMLARDSELAEMATPHHASPRYVPLMPSDFPDVEPWRP